MTINKNINDIITKNINAIINKNIKDLINKNINDINFYGLKLESNQVIIC